MNENLASPTVFPCEADRRYWLLSKALEVVPLDRAIELARAAEAFITQTSSTLRAEPSRTSSLFPAAQGAQGRRGQEEDPVVPSAAPKGPPNAPAEQRRAVIDSTAPQTPQNTPDERGEAALNSAAVDSAPAVATARSRLPLSREQREEILSRMAQGAKNAELASEFGLLPRQVQGIRMGSARELARRRVQLAPVRPKPESIPRPESISTAEACIDEVVRYLRQQDDVVVPDQHGTFLVNARFRMPISELVARANRIRLRQGKPEFKVAESAPVAPEKVLSTNGHPLFWPETRAEA